MTQWRESPGGERQFLSGDGYWYPEGARVASQVQPLGQAPPTIYRKDAVPAANSEARGAAIMVIIGGGVAAVGCLLPWLSASTGLGSLSRNALQTGQHDSFSPDGGLILLM